MCVSTASSFSLNQNTKIVFSDVQDTLSLSGSRNYAFNSSPMPMSYNEVVIGY